MTTAPTLETASLILRAFAPEDAEAYYTAVLSNPQAVRALPTGRPAPRQRVDSIIDSINSHWAEHGFGLWAVTLEDVLIGHAGLQHLDRKTQIEFAYAFHPSHTASDLPVEAGRAVLTYGFETLRMDQILGVVLPQNPGAKRVYNRLGMRPQRRDIRAYDLYLHCYSIRQGDFAY